MLIRPETATDPALIHALTARAFAGAPHSDGSEPRIVDALCAGGAMTLSLVAEHGGTLLGHVAVSPVSINDGTPGWQGLGPISVEPDRQGTGIGSALMQSALAALRAAGAAGCVVLGEPAYYERFGFTRDHHLVYPGPPAEYFMAIAFGSSRPRDEVHYHAAFSGEA